MKIGKTSWLILGFGILIIIFASLGVINSRHVQEQNQLSEELAVAEARLNKLQQDELSVTRDSLEKQLEQTISQSEAAKTTLSQSNEGIDISDNLYRIATACDVEVTEIASQGLAIGDLGEIRASTLPFTIRVEGNVANLINFVTRLNGDFTTGVVKSAEITTSSNTTSEEKPGANIRMVVYTYEGD